MIRTWKCKAFFYNVILWMIFWNMKYLFYNCLLLLLCCSASLQFKRLSRRINKQYKQNMTQIPTYILMETVRQYFIESCKIFTAFATITDDHTENCKIFTTHATIIDVSNGQTVGISSKRCMRLSEC